MSASTTTTTTLQEATRFVTSLVGDEAVFQADTGSLPSDSDPNDSQAENPTASNPSWWPTDHRRIPDYHPARYHPEYYALANNSAREHFMVVMMFRGCHLLTVCQSPWLRYEVMLICLRLPTGFQDALA
jgi:hypothetical protein